MCLVIVYVKAGFCQIQSHIAVLKQTFNLSYNPVLTLPQHENPYKFTYGWPALTIKNAS